MAKRRRKRSPGVTLIKPEGRHGWRVRYTDPDTGRVAKPGIPELQARNAGAREDYCVRLSERLARRKAEIEQGAPTRTRKGLEATIERYYTDHESHRPRAVETYRGATDRLLEWARKKGIKKADDLTRARLIEFRTALINTKKRGTKERRAGATVNKEIRAVKRVLGYLIDLDLFARLSHDDLRRALKAAEATIDPPVYLKPAEVKRTLEAALRHDAATYALTREEKRNGETNGTTPRYEPIAPFVAFVLLTGMRLSEALDVEWDQVDLEALDATGKKVGEIYLRGAANKTKRGRVVGLEVSPALRRLLAAQRLRTGGTGSVWGVTRDTAIKAMRRLRVTYGAPAGFSYQVLRSTCDTYLNNAPGIYGAAAAFRAAKQLGHSVAVSERYYADVIRGIPPDARDLESAMHVRAELENVIASIAAASEFRKVK